MYFWKSQFIPKEIQEHISRALKKAKGGHSAQLPAQSVSEFLKEAQNILSGSQEK